MKEKEVTLLIYSSQFQCVSATASQTKINYSLESMNSCLCSKCTNVWIPLLLLGADLASICYIYDFY